MESKHELSRAEREAGEPEEVPFPEEAAESEQKDIALEEQDNVTSLEPNLEMPFAHGRSAEFEFKGSGVAEVLKHDEHGRSRKGPSPL